MRRVHKIRLVPSAEQETLFRSACGVARFAYNWALAEWRRRYEIGEAISEARLRKELNAVKAERYPWMLEVPKTVPQQAIKNLGRAYANFFADLERYKAGKARRVRRPMFKKKGHHEAFRADNGTWKGHEDAVRVDRKQVFLPRIGWVKMREALRFSGAVKSAVVSRTADRWFISLAVETPAPRPVRVDCAIGGVDLGVIRLATASDGEITDAPRPLRRHLAKLRRLTQRLVRKRFGSKNRAKAKTKLARLYARIADARKDTLHKLTAALVRRFRLIGIEDLNVSGMRSNRCIARPVADVGLAEFRRQLEYKAAWHGSTVVAADRFYPSSKTCSTCSEINEDLKFNTRIWTCMSCGSVHDRDLNAAINLARFAESSAVAVCGAGSAGAVFEVALTTCSESETSQCIKGIAPRTVVAQLVHGFLNRKQ